MSKAGPTSRPGPDSPGLDSPGPDDGEHPAGRLNPRPERSVTARVSALAGYAALGIITLAGASGSTCSVISSNPP